MKPSVLWTTSSTSNSNQCDVYYNQQREAVQRERTRFIKEIQPHHCDCKICKRELRESIRHERIRMKELAKKKADYKKRCERYMKWFRAKRKEQE